MTNFTTDDLRQIADLADHLDFSAPIPTPKGSESRLPLEVLILDAMNEVAVRIEVPHTGDTTITFPSAPAATTGKASA